jgi:hypothetical protein
VLVGPTSGAFLRKEKDEASPPNCFGRLVEFTSIPRLRRLEVFYFRLRTGLSAKTCFGTYRPEQNRKISKMKIRFLAVASLLVIQSIPAATFGDIQLWAGTGANQAALVIDWNDGKTTESLLWGYRWDGSATGLNMLQSIVAADPRLYAHTGAYGWGTAIYGLGYDLDGNGTFGISPGLTFDGSGLATSLDPDDTRVPTDSADHWLEGWNNGFWAYYNKAVSGDVWSESMVGSADRLLSDGVWDGYSFAPDFASAAPSEPLAVAPVPEPTTLALFATAGLFLVCARFKKS